MCLSFNLLWCIMNSDSVQASALIISRWVGLLYPGFNISNQHLSRYLNAGASAASPFTFLVFWCGHGIVSRPLQWHSWSSFPRLHSLLEIHLSHSSMFFFFVASFSLLTIHSECSFPSLLV